MLMLMGLQAELDAMNGGNGLEALAEAEPEKEEGATMMGRQARELMLSGQGQTALQAFKVCFLLPHFFCHTAASLTMHSSVFFRHHSCNILPSLLLIHFLGPQVLHSPPVFQSKHVSFDETGIDKDNSVQTWVFQRLSCQVCPVLPWLLSNCVLHCSPCIAHTHALLRYGSEHLRVQAINSWTNLYINKMNKPACNLEISEHKAKDRLAVSLTAFECKSPERMRTSP